MQLSEIWLRELANLSDSKKLSLPELSHQLTMAGLEVEGIVPVAEAFSDVVVGHVVAKNPHPDADRLNICLVDIGETSGPLQIVCGAKNVAVSQKVPVAKVGAKLPGELNIKKAKLRGVESSGMICSPKELGFEDTIDGIWVLPIDAPIGQNFREYLDLDDHLISLGITPNRGDCLSVVGVARELAAANQENFKFPETKKVPVTITDKMQVYMKSSEACSIYVSRVIRGISKDAKSPLWLTERLRRSGQKSIHPAVDVTNYMNQLFGQPMHVFDFNKIQGSLTIEFSSANLVGQGIDLLDGSSRKIQPKTLLISDGAGPVSLAGVMGGIRTSVDATTMDVVFEVAHFTPSSIAGVPRRYGVHTESSIRFERGVDPTLPLKVIEFATDLLISIVGGEAGPIVSVTGENDAESKKLREIQVSLPRVMVRLGLSDLSMDPVLKSLALIDLSPVQNTSQDFKVTVPSHRFDLEIEEDIAEEIGRLYGLNRIEAILPVSNFVSDQLSEKTSPEEQLISFLAHRGYMQAIHYTFIDPKWQDIFFPEAKSPILKNPIASDMAQMRGSLLPGLLSSVVHNLNRQVNRVHFFEIGRVFLSEETEEDRLALVKVGLKNQIHWSGAPQVDFFDLKGDLEALFKRCGVEIVYAPIFNTKKNISYLHPAQSAEIFMGEKSIGFVGRLHPQVQKNMDIKFPIFIAELDQKVLMIGKVSVFKEISKYPSIRRDLALVLNVETSAGEIIQVCQETLGKKLIEVNVFDVYMGKNIESGKKSLAISLTLQDLSHTLIEEEVVTAINAVLMALESKFQAKLRE
jgi:phenylalanyl-tRNA synthetase beta chain